MKQIDLSRAGLLLAWSVSLFCSQSLIADTDPKFYAVQASATVVADPPQINLVWAADPNATSYTVSRKAVGAANWNAGTSLPGSATQFTDRAVVVGTPYEYQISKATAPGYAGFGYVCAGVKAAVIEDRGKIILLVDSLYAADLVNELMRLQQDLVGDGWTVIRRDVSRTDSAANIKSIIQSEYARDPVNVRSVFLFGHVPVPYSGNLNPDGHPDHQGAWPADAYYGDMDGSWTDNSVNNTSAQHQANWNVPGDGKFDQSELPSDVELQVGRVDLANMTCFSNKTPARYEKDLLRQYLNKDHNFRHGLTVVQRRGLVCDNFGEKSGEAFAASGWRNFSAFFGAENVTSVPGWNYFSTLSSQSYLWSYGCGGGSYYTCDGIGSSDDFANTDIKSVFTMFLGSYFGDWDNESNFLRAPLGSTSSTLAVAWAGRPHWFFHHMGLGETIGYSTRLSQNNRNGGLYSAQNYQTHAIHVALLGDPTLRLHPVLPVSDLKGSPTPDVIALHWTASPDTDVQGYYVYRAPGANGPFVRISGSAPLAQTSFTDPIANSASYMYMVRAIKLERSGSGTYFNPSQGVFFGPDSNTSWGNGAVTPTVPAAPSALSANVNSGSNVTLTWKNTSQNETGLIVERKGNEGTYRVIGTLGAHVAAFSDNGLAAGTVYTYRVAAFNDVGNSTYSNEAQAATPSLAAVQATAQFVAVDLLTRGDWNGLYGTEGFGLMGAAAQFPAYAAVNPAGKADWTWAWPTVDPRGLQEPGFTERLAVAWYSPSTFTVDVNLADGNAHMVSLYCVDWDSAIRRQTIDILDASTGAILNSQSLANFHEGAYLTWNLTGHVVIRLTRNGGYNVTLSGIFFDSAAAGLASVAAPVVTPPGGSFSVPTDVTLSTSTAGASIRYTLDGSEPTAASPEYQGPLTLSTSVLVRAKAFKAGLAESPTTETPFSFNPISTGTAQALFVRADNNSQGNWKAVYGTDGYSIVADPSGPSNYPSYAQVTVTGASAFVWSDVTQDARALQQAKGTGRVAGCWYSPSSFNMDVNFADGRTHRLAVYCLDWDRTGRSETLDVLDADSGALLTSQTARGISEGRYLVWDIKGHVRLRMSNNGGNNAVVMGLFFSASSAQLANPGSGSLSVMASSPLAGGGFHLRLSGQPGERFAVQSSADFIQWKTISEITLTGPTMDLIDPVNVADGTRFYRTRPATEVPQ